jgi:tetratricopeptide (TPR) repeat protein
MSVESRFAHPELIRCAVERSHGARYRSPRKTLHWALLARVAAESCTAEKAGGGARLADLRARAWGQYGNALRIAGRPREAERALETAQRYREKGTGDPNLQAWLFERIAPLALLQNRYEDAIRYCGEAGAIYLKLAESHDFARTLVQRAIALLGANEAESAIHTLDQAIPLIDPEEDPYLLLAAHHNLARCYIDFDRPDEALALHHEARSLYREFKDPLILLRATWQEGILLREIGHLHNAEAALLRARQGYIEQGLGYEMALVSLDLMEVYSKLGKTADVQQVIAEAAPIFRSLRISREALALRLLQREMTWSQD